MTHPPSYLADAQAEAPGDYRRRYSKSLSHGTEQLMRCESMEVVAASPSTAVTYYQHCTGKIIMDRQSAASVSELARLGSAHPQAVAYVYLTLKRLWREV